VGCGTERSGQGERHAGWRVLRGWLRPRPPAPPPTLVSVLVVSTPCANTATLASATRLMLPSTPRFSTMPFTTWLSCRPPPAGGGGRGRACTRQGVAQECCQASQCCDKLCCTEQPGRGHAPDAPLRAALPERRPPLIFTTRTLSTLKLCGFLGTTSMHASARPGAAARWVKAWLQLRMRTAGLGTSPRGSHLR
jgi:hypothetical protein